MCAAFDLSYGKLARDPRFAELARELGALTRIDSRESFNRFAREAIRLWNNHFGEAPVGKTSALFQELLGRVEQGGQKVIQTGWGGVVITAHEHPRVEKYLVIRKGAYLALEKHEEKDEFLDVREGSGIVLWRSASDQPLAVEAPAPGDKFHFEPGMEHCVIGTEDLLIFEHSLDPKGMDQDLIFIYEPDGAPSLTKQPPA
jgi:mannose-6-phosphate isomerase-like protein (cupin superfamily)